MVSPKFGMATVNFRARALKLRLGNKRVLLPPRGLGLTVAAERANQRADPIGSEKGSSQLPGLGYPIAATFPRMQQPNPMGPILWFFKFAKKETLPRVS